MPKLDIIKEIYDTVEKERISKAFFEGANIVLYTTDREYLLNPGEDIKKAVDLLKKRIELRADPAILKSQKNVEESIRKMVPEEAEIRDILFDPARSVVVIEALKPGLVIGKEGSLLRQIKEETLWMPNVRRAPPVKSKIVDDIRKVLFIESEYRRDFLNNVGHRIYDGWTRNKREEWVRMSFLGGARQVGKSCLLLQTPESRVLIDCGVDITDSNNGYPFLDSPDFKINEIDAVIVSHSHLDHVGFVPYLFKFGYRGPVYCTEPTRDVSAMLLIDYIKVMMDKRKDPVFSMDDIKEFIKHTVTLNYEEVSDITPDIRITLYNAGHILGSSMVHLHIGNGLHNILYTGDLKYAKSLLLDQSETRFPRLETLITESTYGGKDNVLMTKKESEDMLVSAVKETLENKGKVLVPVLGSGRAQEVMMLIEKAMREGSLPVHPVYVDGMVWDITAIYSAYPEFFNSHLKKLIFHMDLNPFLSQVFKQVGSAKERQEVIDGEPCIVLATSGMLVGGPSVEYLKNFGDNPRNLLLFVSYQGEGSLGRRIQNGEREIAFASGENRHEVLQLKANVVTVEGLSGHSDRKQLMSFVGALNPKPKKVIILHGEVSRGIDLASSLHKAYRIETVVPRNLDAIRLR
ncbi:MAG TPA: beta-CASP ribonuclease aCPSF1 [Candidatus Woesearchaeota archaeon]|nr:beta-CASP ribonuclease aCPSF1 [Candidatus Woesearchaeota archaeon]